MSTVYRVNSPKVISEVFDDEVVAVNFDTGSYYGMSETAQVIWRLLEQGASAEIMTKHLMFVYDGDEQTIGNTIQEFLAQLSKQDLIVESTSNGWDMVPELASGTRGPWAPPTLSVFEDMQELLLVDPIHDVDEAGWPARKPDNLP
jgi:hypothetical protein